MTALLEVEGLVGGYGAADEILKGIDLALPARRMAAIVGPNGAGKSTLLKAIAGLLKPKAGGIRLEGRALGGLPPRSIAAAGIAFVPQEANIFPSLSVRENLEMGGYLEPRATVAQRVEALFARFPMLAEKRRRAARTLSGGQRQILAMGMALMVAPKLLLLDEPSAGLSPKAAQGLFDDIAAIHAEGTAILMVEQNALEALAIAEDGIVLVDGRVARTGQAAALAADPEVRRLFLGG
ncbi:ABC transporter ATP-binding protein [Falsiroseomonas selenitidurans]|uniref:ABC transporter ATP-binding protein n=1 Tax=Falsiroseomonas selenitidurans TaxID=2716335 RepID=UPI001ADE6858|nr:ABC transporter ATP-binding protein [Falsiroseomonas selenitidurans]